MACWPRKSWATWSRCPIKPTCPARTRWRRRSAIRDCPRAGADPPRLAHRGRARVEPQHRLFRRRQADRRRRGCAPARISMTASSKPPTRPFACTISRCAPGAVQDVFREYAKTHGVDPALVLGPGAPGEPVPPGIALEPGATGMMQLMRAPRVRRSEAGPAQLPSAPHERGADQRRPGHQISQAGARPGRPPDPRFDRLQRRPGARRGAGATRGRSRARSTSRRFLSARRATT